jgi:hypothetical protein
VGFDAGTGLPDSTDKRDMLYFWPPGSFVMDRAALDARIAGRAELVIGDISKTALTWEPSADASPAYSFKHTVPKSWHQQIYLYHRFNHPQYNQLLRAKEERDQLGLRTTL